MCLVKLGSYKLSFKIVKGGKFVLCGIMSVGLEFELW